MRTSRLFMPLTLELKLSFELQIVHDPASQRSVATRDDLNHRLHRRVTIRPNERKLQTAIAVATPLRDVCVPHRGAATAASGTRRKHRHIPSPDAETRPAMCQRF